MSAKKVEATITINVASTKIISAFTDFELLKDWWKVDRCSVSKQVAGIYFLVWGAPNEGIKYVSSGIIDTYNPLNELRIKDFTYLCEDRSILGGMTLEIRVKLLEKGISEVYVCQDGYKYGEHWDWYYDAVSKAWPQMLGILKKYLEK